MGRPRIVAILLKSTRLTTSLALPPANGMITVIGRLGKFCALAASAAKAVAAHNAIAHDLLNFILLPECEPASLRDRRISFGVRSDAVAQFDFSVVTIKPFLFRRKRRRLGDPVGAHAIVARPDRRGVVHLI